MHKQTKQPFKTADIALTCIVRNLRGLLLEWVIDVRTLLMKGQHCVRTWFGVTRQEAIVSAKVGSVPSQHLLSLPNYMENEATVYPKKYAYGFCFSVLCCGYTLTDFPISIRLTSLALWQSNDCPSASKATLMNMDKYFMWIHYERLHNHNKAKHNKTVCIFLGIYYRVFVQSS